MTTNSRNPQNWDEYQYGTSYTGSIGSVAGRSVQFRPSSPSASSALQDAEGGESNEHDLRKRRYGDNALFSMRRKPTQESFLPISISLFAFTFTHLYAFSEESADTSGWWSRALSQDARILISRHSLPA
jgi:hypothetical protein